MVEAIKPKTARPLSKYEFSEFLELIDFTEKVSKEAQEIKITRSKLLFNSVLYFGLGFLSTIGGYVFTIDYNNSGSSNDTAFILGITAFFIAIGFFIAGSNRYLKYSALKYKLKHEDDTLKKLMTMVNTHKELRMSELSITSQAILEMRLNRINYSID